MQIGNYKMWFGASLVIFIVVSLLAAAPVATASTKTTLFARTTSKVVGIGGSVSFDIQLTNNGKPGEDPVTYELLIQDLPQDWRVRFFYQEEQISTIVLKPGETLTVKVEILTSPNSAPGTYQPIFVAYSWMADYTNSLTLTVELPEPTREVKLTSAYPGVSAYLGDTIQHSLVVQNTGETSELLRLSAVAPDGWTVKFISQQSEVTSVYLSAGQSASLTVTTVTPDNAAPGEYTLVVGASTIDGEVKASLELSVNLREKETESAFDFVSQFSEITAEAGKSLTYPITLRNTSSSDQVITLSVASAPEKWKVVFKSGDIEITKVTLAPGQSLALLLQATPPSEVSVGDYSIVVEAMGDSASRQMVLNAKIVGLYKLDVQPSTLYTQTTAGNQLAFTVRVTNSGQSPVTTLSLQVNAPSGWNVSSSPPKVSTLDPKDSYTFNVVAIPPSDTVAGDYLLSISASSDQYSSDEVQLRVTVEAPASWALVGVAVAAIAVVLLIAVFRKFSRR